MNAADGARYYVEIIVRIIELDGVAHGIGLLDVVQ